ncbi:uncharacterized protein LOC135477930 [Liolophura sinensis]|uniref:uncharacterized protein LOC135477930 n=1 Tax=Liolophura sinensis TaxID=3198878 RepID=UPI00315987A8
MNGEGPEAGIEHVVGLLRGGWEYLAMDRKIQTSKQFAMDHPVATLFILVTVAMCCIPIFCFMAFVFGSIVLTFAGFVFLESTVVTLAAVVLGAVLFLVSLFSVGFSTFIVLAFYLISFGHNMVQSVINRYQQMTDHDNTEVSSTSSDTDGVGEPVYDGNGCPKNSKHLIHNPIEIRSYINLSYVLEITQAVEWLSVI